MGEIWNLVTTIVTGIAITLIFSRKHNAMQTALAQLETREKHCVIQGRCAALALTCGVGSASRTNSVSFTPLQRESAMYVVGDANALLAVTPFVDDRDEAEFVQTLSMAVAVLRAAVIDDQGEDFERLRRRFKNALSEGATLAPRATLRHELTQLATAV